MCVPAIFGLETGGLGPARVKRRVSIAMAPITDVMRHKLHSE